MFTSSLVLFVYLLSPSTFLNLRSFLIPLCDQCFKQRFLICIETTGILFYLYKAIFYILSEIRSLKVLVSETQYLGALVIIGHQILLQLVAFVLPKPQKKVVSKIKLC